MRKGGGFEDKLERTKTETYKYGMMEKSIQEYVVVKETSENSLECLMSPK